MLRPTRRSLLTSLLAAPIAACTRGRTSPSQPIPFSSRTGHSRTASLIVRGDIWTLDPATPRASAVAIADDLIIAVGTDAEISELRGPSTVVLETSGTVTPGLVDAHAHLEGLGESLLTVDLRGATSTSEVVERLRAGAPEHGWVVGRGWDQNLWPGAAMPTHHPLTQAFPDRPVWLRRIDGHAAWGNAALLRESRIRQDTPNPAGGEVLRDNSGTATGVLIDAAMALVSPPKPTVSEVRRRIDVAQRHVLERGLTGIHDMGIGEDTDATYRVMAGDPEGLRIRVHAYATEDWFIDDLRTYAPDPHLVGGRYALVGVKVYADGALGSRGAALLDPYTDRPDHRGLMQHDARSLQRIVDAAFSAGWQVATHAIGDAANRRVLESYGRATRSFGLPRARPRVEHCQLLHAADIPRFAALGVVASMQPTHATSDMAWVPDRIGAARMEGAYAWRSLIDAGAHVCFGSDFPVELADVTHGLYAALTRQDPKGNPPGGWLPEQRLGLEQALRCFSTEAAYAVHREAELGQITVGRRADLTCFGERLNEQVPIAMRATPVLGTVIGGRPEHWTG